MASKASLMALVVRDAVQQARRGSVTLARLAFAAAMIGFVVLLASSAVEVEGFDVAQLGELGRTVFLRLSQIQFWVACAAAALLVAQGIVEEREGDTLDLLAITRLRPAQVLLGKVASRLLLLATLVLAGTPAMALLLGYGGVAPLEVASAVVNTLVAVACTALMAATLAMFFRGPVAPALIALLYAAIAFGPIPWFMGTISGGHFAAQRMSPVLAGQAGWLGLWLPALTLAPAAVLIMQVAGPLFEIVVSRDLTGGDAGFGAHSHAVWPFERLNKVGILITGLTLGSMLLIAPLVAIGVPVLGELWTALAQVSLAWVTMRLVLWAVEARERYRERVQRRWLDPMWADHGIAAGGMEAPVWRNPVAWRECATQTFGRMSRAILVTYLSYAALLVLMLSWMIEDPGRARALAFPFAQGHLAAAALGAVLHATTTMVAERRRGTLALLVVSPLSSRRILGGKLAGTLLYTGPLLVAGLVLLLVDGLAGMSPVHWSLLHEEPSWFVVGTPLTRALWTVLWALAAYLMLVLASYGAALRLRRPGAAYGVSLLAVVAWIGVPAVVAASPVDLPQLVSAMALLFPLADPRYGAGTVPPEMAISLGALVVVVLALAGVLTARLRRWVGSLA